MGCSLRFSLRCRHATHSRETERYHWFEPYFSPQLQSLGKVGARQLVIALVMYRVGQVVERYDDPVFPTRRSHKGQDFLISAEGRHIVVLLPRHFPKVS